MSSNKLAPVPTFQRTHSKNTTEEITLLQKNIDHSKSELHACVLIMVCNELSIYLDRDKWEPYKTLCVQLINNTVFVKFTLRV